MRNGSPQSAIRTGTGQARDVSEGYYRFLCPRCGEMRATVNPRNNLAHCFHCGKNYNNIDLLIALDYRFSSAVALLERLLEQYQAQRPKKKPTATPH